MKEQQYWGGERSRTATPKSRGRRILRLQNFGTGFNGALIAVGHLESDACIAPAVLGEQRPHTYGVQHSRVLKEPQYPRISKPH
jgi:hypothetical protein